MEARAAAQTRVGRGAQPSSFRSGTTERACERADAVPRASAPCAPPCLQDAGDIRQQQERSGAQQALVCHGSAFLSCATLPTCTSDDGGAGGIRHFMAVVGYSLAADDG